MERTYDINELSLMSGFTTRTLRTYLAQGLLNGNKDSGSWRFTVEDLDHFFNEPFIKEGLKIKQNSVVFDFLTDQKNDGRSCIVIHRKATRKEGDQISAFFCKAMENAADVTFKYNWTDGNCRVILSGDEGQVYHLLDAFYHEFQ